jgi:hypothetical protein
MDALSITTSFAGHKGKTAVLAFDQAGVGALRYARQAMDHPGDETGHKAVSDYRMASVYFSARLVPVSKITLCRY